MSTSFSRFSPRWTIVILPALLWLGGCGGPTSITGLRQHPHQAYSFEVPADCGTVYLRIARRAQEQYRVITLATYQPAVSARLAPDGQSGTVTLVNAGGIGLRYILTADLHAVESSRTAVSLYCANRSAAQEAVLWRQWANTSLEAGKEQSGGEKRKNDADGGQQEQERVSQPSPGIER